MITWITALYAGGLLLLLSELVLPGLVCGILGGGLLITSMVLTARHFPDSALLFVLIEMVIGVIVFVGGMWFLPKLGLRFGLMHTKTMDADAGYVNVLENPTLLGKIGTVDGMLRPAGIIVLDGERMDVVTAGEFIEDGAPVRVIAVEGNRIVVERAA